MATNSAALPERTIIPQPEFSGLRDTLAGHMRSPKHRGPIVILAWLLAVVLPVYLAFQAFFYYPQAARLAPPEADTALAGIVPTVMLAGCLLPIFVITTLVCTNWTVPGRGFFAWRRDRPLWSIAVSFALGLPAAAALLLSLTDLWPLQPWYDYLILPFVVFFAVWLLLLRAAILSR